MEMGVKGMLVASLIRLFLSTAVNREPSVSDAGAADPQSNQPYLSSVAEDPRSTGTKKF